MAETLSKDQQTSFPPSIPVSSRNLNQPRLSRTESTPSIIVPSDHDPSTPSIPGSHLSNSSSIYSSPSYSAFSSHGDFTFYPEALPSNPYLLPRQGSVQQDSPPWHGQTTTEDEMGASGMDMNIEDDLDFEAGVVSEPVMAGVTSKLKPRTPRPPNAWILYRSDKLKAIAAGETLPGQDRLLVEAGLSSASASSGDDSSMLNSGRRSAKGKRSSATNGTPLTSNVPSPDDPETALSGSNHSMAPPPVPKMKKGKKGSKDPTEGYLSLGRGKTGRGLPQADISKMISIAWKRETPEVRKKYERMSEMRKIEHLEKFPGYKFQPQRKADKIRIREEREQEKEAKRKEKAAKPTTGKSKKNKMSTKASPSSPYSSISSRPALSRSHSTSWLSHGREELSASAPIAIVSGRNVERPGSAPSIEKDPMKHPFAFPHRSLPSVKPEQLGEALFTNDGQNSSAHQSYENSRSTSPLKHETFPGPEYQQRMWSPVPDAGYDQPMFLDMPGLGSTYTVPFLMDPIPLPEGYSLDNLEPLLPVEGDAETLAALWCVMEENLDGRQQTAHDINTIDHHNNMNNNDFAGLTRWPGQGQDLVSQWSTLGYPGQFELSNTVAESVMADWQDRQPTAPQIMQVQPGMYYEPTYPTGDYLDIAYSVEPNLDPNISFNTSQLEQPESQRGPFLSAAMPISPISWSSATTPRESTFLRAQAAHNNYTDRRVSSTTSGSSGNNLTTPRATSFSTSSLMIPPPRYVSTSAFPTSHDSSMPNSNSDANSTENRLSVDPASLTTTTNGNGWQGNFDRQASFAAGQLLPDLVTDDVLNWEGDENARSVSNTGTVRIVSGVSTISNGSTSGSTNRMDIITESKESTSHSRVDQSTMTDVKLEPKSPTHGATDNMASKKGNTTWVVPRTNPLLQTTRLDPPPPPRGRGRPRIVASKFDSTSEPE